MKNGRLRAVNHLRKSNKTEEQIDEIAEKMLEMGYSEDIVGPLIETFHNNQRTPQEIAEVIGVSLATIYRDFNTLDQMEEEKQA